ncbi:MAG TPA: ATP-binding protein [Patescibacteria group bacterium]|nr:ATP-binding protein [Patescibacteria group bacterium]
MLITRIATKQLKKLAKGFPVVAVVGPRQSGKTTLVQHTFPRMRYISLEDLDTRSFAENDPRGFLTTYQPPIIFDEIQRSPQLLSYMQGVIDQNKNPGQFILTGSQNFLLYQGISQTLAGRVAILHLLPLSLEELSYTQYTSKEYIHYLYQGFYPRLYETKLNPRDWYLNYIQTYVERDVRQVKNITDLNAFQRFIAMCAGNIGQLLNLSSLANDCGITHNTAKSWLSLLETSFIIFLLKPHYKNFKKRLVKMPKLYFYDTGLASSLLRIENSQQLLSHPLKGNLFESLVISELFKYRLNRGISTPFYFWRDKVGHEIDCIFETGKKLLPIEIKSGKTITDDYFTNLDYWKNLTSAQHACMVYGGDEIQKRSDITIFSWRNIPDLLL